MTRQNKMETTRQDSVLSNESAASHTTVQYESTIVKVEGNETYLGNVDVSPTRGGQFIGMNPHIMEFPSETSGSDSTLVDRRDAVISTASSQSSMTSYASEEMLATQERKIAKLEIDKHTDFCNTVSVNYKHRGKTHRQHYVSNMKELDIDGSTGLRHLDELLYVNGKQLFDEKLKKVKKIFKKIIPNRRGGDIHMQLKVRRWKAREGDHREGVRYDVMDVVIYLKLTPTYAASLNHHDRKQKFQASISRVRTEREKELPVGNINIIERQKNDHAWFGIVGEETHLLVSSDGLLKSSSTDQSKLVTEFFTGNDLTPMPWTFTVFCIRLAHCVTDDDRMQYMTSDLCNNDTELQFKHNRDDTDEIDAQTVDERCFIRRSIGDVLLLESLIYRDKFIYFDNESKTFRMKSLSAPALNSLHRGHPNEELLAGYLFRLSRVYQKPNFLSRHFGQYFSCGLLGHRRKDMG